MKKKLKYIKILSILFILTMILSFTAVKAYDNPPSAQWMISDLKHSSWNTGEKFAKTALDINQSMYNREMFTAITNPCTNCVLESKLIRDDPYEVTDINQSKMGDYIKFSNLSSVNGVYDLQLKRYDFTLLDTYSYGTWYINMVPSNY